MLVDGGLERPAQMQRPGAVSFARGREVQLLYKFIGFQFSRGAIIRVKVTAAGDAANGAGVADLPIGPVGCAALVIGLPGVAAIAGAPRISGVEVLAVIISDPGLQLDAAGLVVFDQVAGAAARVAINDHVFNA